jgi:hypothetical protein
VETAERQQTTIAQLQQIIREDLLDDTVARSYAREVLDGEQVEGTAVDYPPLSHIVKLLVADIKHLRREKLRLQDIIDNTLS